MCCKERKHSMASQSFHFNFKKIYVYKTLVDVLSVHMCVGAQQGQNRALDALGLDLEITMSHHIGAGN